ncbi:hypothetical protein ACFYVL_36275 [Streptomyces sp. NPDC004111]|uniref:hypothetical protein n=1 Tax=Streptomyces sp. NPDC004111 TaxID=3364690 RepID=UPI00368436CF
MERPFVPGISIEGHEYSGKSSLARLVAEGLRERGRTVTQSHGTLTRGGLVDAMFAEELAVFEGAGGRPFHDPRLWRRFNSVRSAQLVIDAELAAQRTVHPGELRVQDRYWLTQHSFNSHLTPGEGHLPPEWIRTRAPRFTVQVYLTCTADTRRQRAAQRAGGPAKHAINAFLHRHLDEVAVLDEATAALADGDPLWTVLRSDRVPAHRLAARVLALFDARDRTAPAAPAHRTAAVA